MDGTRIDRRRDEHRHRRLAEHSLGGRSKEQLARTGQAVRAHHDQIARPLARDPQNLDRRLANRYVVVTGRKRRRPVPEHTGDELPNLTLGDIARPMNARPEIHRDGQQRILDGQDDQPGRKVFGNGRLLVTDRRDGVHATGRANRDDERGQ